VALRMLTSLRSSFSKIEGSQEIRTSMRHEIEAFRVFYGQPIMVTFSPHEKHSLLVVRMYRLREGDPVHASYDGEQHERSKRWGSMDSPSIPKVDMEQLGDNTDYEEAHLPIHELIDAIPDYDERTRIAASNPLACVNAFTVLCKIALFTLFGVRVCNDCPHCDCCDVFGSVARPSGGLFGRPDAYYGSKECQKAGSLHLHMLLFLQSLHQHATVAELLKAADKSTLLDFFQYKANTDNETYVDTKKVENNQDSIEADWKTGQVDRTHLLLRAHSNVNMSPKRWSELYMNMLQKTQQLVNHHVHPKDHDGEHQILKGDNQSMCATSSATCGVLPAYRCLSFVVLGCKTKAVPDECRGRFPRCMETAMFGEEQVVLCPGLAKRAKLKTSGRKNCLFSAFGKRNNPWLNGACPGLLINLGCNSDTLNPWRMPLTPTTHCTSLCQENCTSDDMVNRAVQTIRRAQRDQAGYISDYASKKQPMAREEIKRVQASHDRLYNSLLRAKLGARGIARRHAGRVMSDLYGRGVLRMSTEIVNLLSMRRGDDKLFAETFRSNIVGYMDCYHFMKCATSDQKWSHAVKPRKLAYTTTLQQQPSLSYCYGWRGFHKCLYELSPYEFLCMYVIRPTTISRSSKPSDSKHCYLTTQGVAAGNKNPDLAPGVDYLISGDEGIIDGSMVPWYAFPESSGLRHDWVIELRPHRVPLSFSGIALPRRCTREEQAHHMSVYFRPWVLPPALATECIPVITNLCNLEVTTWESSFTEFCNQVPTEFMKNIIVNFQAVYSLREQEASGIGDEEFVAPTFKWTHHEFQHAKETKIRSNKIGGEDVIDPIAQRSFDIVNGTRLTSYPYCIISVLATIS
jgi:hypothetical protein